MPSYRLRVWLQPNQELGYAPFSETWRELEVDGSHTLADLHEAIFTAFDREHERDYEFGTRNKNGIETRIYVPPEEYDGAPSWPAQDPDEIERFLDEVLPDSPDHAKARFRELREDPPPEGNAADTTIAELDPEDLGALRYEFDLANGWEHQIEVRETYDGAMDGEPKLVDGEGEAPRQTPRPDEAEQPEPGGPSWLAGIRTAVSRLKRLTR